MPVPRSYLHFQALVWRGLMRLGISIHNHSAPTPSFARKVEVAAPYTPGSFWIYFYVPPSYNDPTAEQKKYPVILNFHGGGFTIGSATDDARWVQVVHTRLDVMVVSVDYRLAPEYPFPVGAQDGYSAVKYLCENSDSLRLDMNRLITNGFSAGGNFAFTVPLMLHLQPQEKRPQCTVVAISAFYPAVDFTLGRLARRATNPSPSHELSAQLTDLFDAAYLFPPDLDLTDPLISPAAASDDILKNGLPNDIVLYTCEFDGLQAEGDKFAKRLMKLGKRVIFKKVLGVAHAWDKHPSLWSAPEGADKCYAEACEQLKRTLEKN